MGIERESVLARVSLREKKICLKGYIGARERRVLRERDCDRSSGEEQEKFRKRFRMREKIRKSRRERIKKREIEREKGGQRE